MARTGRKQLETEAREEKSTHLHAAVRQVENRDLRAEAGHETEDDQYENMQTDDGKMKIEAKLPLHTNERQLSQQEEQTEETRQESSQPQILETECQPEDDRMQNEETNADESRSKKHEQSSQTYCGSQSDVDRPQTDLRQAQIAAVQREPNDCHVGGLVFSEYFRPSAQFESGNCSFLSCINVTRFSRKSMSSLFTYWHSWKIKQNAVYCDYVNQPCILKYKEMCGQLK